ncbi:MAG: hypothetical protein ABEK50_05945 [bacterium]
MDQGELQLRKSDAMRNMTADDLDKDDEVELYSEYYNQAFTVKITHKHGEELGGDIVDTMVDDPMLGERDIIHFRPSHIQEIH